MYFFGKSMEQTVFHKVARVATVWKVKYIYEKYVVNLL